LRTNGNFLGFPSEKFSGVRVWPPCYIVVKDIEVLVALTTFVSLLDVKATGFIKIHQELRINEHFLVHPSGAFPE